MKICKIIESAKGADTFLREVNLKNRIITNEVPIHCNLTLDFTTLASTGNRKFEGFGGALTESSASVLQQLAKETQQKIITAYFSQDSEKGNGYTLARTHMNSCDFSLANWACVDKKDETLESFSMEQTDKYITPLVKEAQSEITNTSSRQSLSLLISPWSPPAWMKDNNDMNHGGHLLKKYYQLWADYFVRFLTEFKKRDIPVWTVSVQNEAEANQTWDSCLWSAEQEATFVQEHLGPTLEKAGFETTSILIWDHNRDKVLERMQSSMNTVKESLKDASAKRDYIGGIAYHWYSGDQYENVQACANKWPTKKLIFSEGCVEGGPRPGAWFTGERYAHNIINDLKNGCTGWIDWNILLDTKGGPNHVGNYCDAPILADPKTGDVIYNSSYYYIGQFSRFIRPGAVYIPTTHSFGMCPATADGKVGNMIEYVAFKNENDTTALILCNRTEENANFTVNFKGTQNNEKFSITCPPRAIQTLIFK
jgi:glucosylceramidase